jgi:type IV pilus assembly protein PilA
MIGMLFEVGKLLVTGKESHTPPPNGQTQMKTELQAKYIQFLNNKNKDSDKGFTLIELLVVIIIIGVLSAIALPSFLNQTAKAKQSEAKTTISSVNSAQNSFRNENTAFASDIPALALGLATTSASYNFEVNSGTDTTQILSKNADTALKTYTGGNVRFTDASSQSAVATIICEANTAGANTGGIALGTKAPTATTVDAAIACASTQKELGQAAPAAS